MSARPLFLCGRRHALQLEVILEALEEKCRVYNQIMVEGPGCKVKGEKLKPRIKGQVVEAVTGDTVDKVDQIDLQLTLPTRNMGLNLDLDLDSDDDD